MFLLIFYYKNLQTYREVERGLWRIAHPPSCVQQRGQKHNSRLCCSLIPLVCVFPPSIITNFQNDLGKIHAKSAPGSLCEQAQTHISFNYDLDSTGLLYCKCWVTCLFSILPVISPSYILIYFNINLKRMHNSL